MTMVLHPIRKDGARQARPSKPGRRRQPAEPASSRRQPATGAAEAPAAPETTEQRDAEDEDPPGRRQALQGHGTGKIRRRKANRAHLLEKKSTKRTRRLGRRAEVTGGDKKRVERLLGR